MRELPIAYGNSSHARFWMNKTIRWDELCDRLRTTVRTTETSEEYAKMRKADREAAKDKGGFIAGHLRDNRRKVENVVCRSMLALDGDKLEKGFMERFKAGCRYRAAFYTTHSHTPDAPRGRFILPFTRDVTPDEYIAIARFFASEWGIDQFDECSYKVNQLMYWPTSPSNGEYIFGEVDGPWLDPDEYLAGHPQWRDMSLLPTSCRESSVRESSKKPQEDPLTKKGVVGAFCRTYSIEDAIALFLSDVYAPSAVEGRYDYVPGEGSAGVVVYDGRFAYSHHATDPACGKLLNAFDLVRIHRFGNLDDDSGGVTSPSRLPSYREMLRFATECEDVKLTMLEENRRQAESEFGPLESDGDGEEWKRQLVFMPRSRLLENSVWNLGLILRNDRRLANFAYNEMACQVEVTGPVPWSRPEGSRFWRNADTAQLKSFLDINYIPFSDRNHAVSFDKVVDDRRFHPIRDYLDNLPPWDGKPRVDTLFIDLLDADDNAYVRAVTRKTLAAAVARVYRPGIKFDSVTVLDGDQGIGKSTIWKQLAGDSHFSDTLSLTDMDDKSGAEKLQGYWIVEIGELAGMRKADIEKVKSFLSCSDDKYRPSYARTVENHPRQCIVVATVNGERGYLRDVTGNRRFWIVKCNRKGKTVDWTIGGALRDQIWAEARRRYLDGERLYLETDLEGEAEKAQRSAMEADERQGMVERYLARLLPETWDSMDIHRRRDFLNGDITSPEGTVRRTSVSNAEIWCECFGKAMSDLKPSDSYAIAALMMQVEGWERTSRRMRLPIYGMQRVYVAKDGDRVCDKDGSLP